MATISLERDIILNKQDGIILQETKPTKKYYETLAKDKEQSKRVMSKPTLTWMKKK
ncbi:MAG: hypothetical protein ACRCWD_01660 [Culicoidibacterales bacterium]